MPYIIPVLTNVLARVIAYTSGNAVVTTLAGSGSVGSGDGVGTGASFRNPNGVVELPDGNILNCDSANNRLRIITPQGGVTTLAGNSTPALTDGTGAGASFNYPQEACVMPLDGKIIVSDRFNHCLRLVTYPGGVVTTFATGFNQPQGISVIPSTGNIVVADGDNRVIKHVTYPGGVVTTLASGFNFPFGVAVLPNGKIAVSEYGGHVIKIITTPTYAANSGVVVTLAGSGTPESADGTGTYAGFREPIGLAVLPNGNIIVADIGGGVRMITSSTYAANSGVVTTLLNSSDGFSVGVLRNGNIITGNTFSHRVRIIRFT
jgi:glucose/arabinose dehydrogenase